MKTKKGIIPTVFHRFKHIVANNSWIVGVFLFIGMVNAGMLTVLYLAPRPPLSLVFAPLIRKLWGEQFLHYPMNFYLLPKLFNYAHLAVSISIGIFMTAILIKLFELISLTEEKVAAGKNLFYAIKIAFRKYISMVIYFLFLYGMTLLIQYSTKSVFPPFDHLTRVGKGFYILYHFGGMLLLQSVFIFVFPSLIISEYSLVRAVRANFIALRRAFFPSVFFVFLSSVLYMGVIINNVLLPKFMKLYEPEVMLISLSVTILLTLIVDFFITSFSAVLYLEIRDRNKGAL